MTWHRAEYWHQDAAQRAVCDLCPHHCRPAEGESGRCRARGVREGVFCALGYGRISSAHLDPIEKKPLYHFKPGSVIFSVGGWGCNLACAFCQNWSISQAAPPDDGRVATPAQIIAEARRVSCGSIAYTYNEPLVEFEFVRDCARLARQAGIRNVLVTNGFVNPPPAAELLPFIDALNVDVKSMAPRFYREQCRGQLEPVLQFCVQAVAAGCHIEITNLLIPTLNDDIATVTALAEWIKADLGVATPLHLSAYHPDFKCDIAPTPVVVLERAYAACKRHLSYVYIGNAGTRPGQDTVCPQCGHELIKRRGYTTTVTGLSNGACKQCGRKADLAGAD